MKPGERGAKHGAGKLTPLCYGLRLKNFEGGGRDHGAEDEHAAEPHDQRENVDVPQREHRVIIIITLGGILSPVQTSSRVAALKNVATRLRIDSVPATSEAGSGHPTSCASAAEIVATLFFSEMRYDPRQPHDTDHERVGLAHG